MARPFVHLGADHAGFSLKETLKRALRQQGFPVVDHGNETKDPRDDYPLFAEHVGLAVANDPKSFGILSCGNGVGVCMVANKIPGGRAALVTSLQTAKTARTDDNANILCLPGRTITKKEALLYMKKFLSTRFSGAKRHKRRLAEIQRIEKRFSNPSSPSL